MGHVPPGPLPPQRAGAELPRRQHRGAGAQLPPLRLARLGEAAAVSFLSRRGAFVESRNLRLGRLEVDAVVRLGGRRVVVEVKTRHDGGDPMLELDAAKEDHLRDAARRLRASRIDFVGVIVGRKGVTIRWVPNVC